MTEVMKERKSAHQIQSELSHKGFASIPYPDKLRFEIKDLMNTFKLFCNQSANHKGLIPFVETGGYEFKNKFNDTKLLDFKEDFHVTIDYRLPNILNASNFDTDFINQSQRLLKEGLTEHLKEVAKYFLEITMKNFPLLAMDPHGWVLRFLHYYPQQGDLAHYHIDKGGHTIHLLESGPGLECFWGGEWRPMDFDEMEMVFFPGALGQYVSGGELKALCHRVVSNRDSKHTGRWSMVLFNDYPKCEYIYDKESFGPTQKAFKPGENYGMTHERFSKFFVERTVLDAR